MRAPATTRQADGDWLLRARGLTKVYQPRAGGTPVFAADDVDIVLRKGKTLALVGESGCGKTTTSRCILRAVDPTSGEILYRKEDGSVVDLATLRDRELRPLRTEIQMVFQDPMSSLNPRLSVRETIAEPLHLSGLKNRAAIDDRVAELLDLVGLRSDHMSRYPHAFSGGQRQRIGIARALARDPRIIVADEAVSALDVSVQAQILNLFLDLQERLGHSYLFVSHDLSVVRHISDEVAVMYLGQIVESGPSESLFTKPLHPYTAALIDAIPRISRRGQPSRILPGEASTAVSGQEGCHFRYRCAYAESRCATGRIPIEETEPGRQVRCVRARELSLTGVSDHE